MEEKSLKEQLKEINEKLDETKKTKEKKFRLPWKAKVSNKKLKQGYATVQIINENREVDFKKFPIIDGTIKLDDTFHAIGENGIFTYKGKPFLHQYKGKLNPFEIPQKNETYGQKYVMARMKSDFITAKKSLGWGIGIFTMIVVGIIIYGLFFGG